MRPAAAFGRFLRTTTSALVNVPHLLTGISSAVGNLALPPICAGCEQDIESVGATIPLCPECRRMLSTPAGPICSRCAAPAPAPSIRADGCTHCRADAYRFDQITALAVYQGKVQSFVLRMKGEFDDSRALAAGRLLAQQVRGQQWPLVPELVTAPPRHWLRRILHGAHAADVLAEAVAHDLNLPLALDLLRATKLVARQATLTPAGRRRNLRKAFTASTAYDIQGAHVLLVDDVLTTGTTANAVSLALRKAGAKTVSVAVVARAIGAT